MYLDGEEENSVIVRSRLTAAAPALQNTTKTNHSRSLSTSNYDPVTVHIPLLDTTGNTHNSVKENILRVTPMAASASTVDLPTLELVVIDGTDPAPTPTTPHPTAAATTLPHLNATATTAQTKPNTQLLDVRSTC